MRFRFKSRTSADLPWVNIATLDLLWGVIAPILALASRDIDLFSHEQLTTSLIYIGVSSVLTAASFIWFRLSHSVSRYFSVDDALNVVKASAVAVGLTVVVCFLLWRLDNIPRLVPLVHFAVLAIGNIVGRMQRYLRRRRRDRPKSFRHDAENLLIVGVSDLCWYYIQLIENLASDHFSVVALVDDSRSLQNRFVHGYQVAGRIKDLSEVLEEYDNHGVQIHRLVIAVDPKALSSETMDYIHQVASERGAAVDVLQERLALDSGDHAVSFPAEPIVCELGKPLFWKTKRAFDILMSGLLLILTFPLAAVASCLVLIDLGAPLLFWQVRIGRGRRKIAVYKFRTLQARYRRGDQRLSLADRTSWLGNLLRRTHLDELPQLLGILAGEISLVGPRPLLPVDLAENTGLRTAVRPGITGWAQINGGTLLTREEKNAMDEWYIRHASWKLEIRILALTVLELFRAGKRNEAAIAEALREKKTVTDFATSRAVGGELKKKAVAAEDHPSMVPAINTEGMGDAIRIEAQTLQPKLRR